MTKLYIKYNILLRCAARFGRALCLGRRNRRFKSCHIGCARINKYQESIYNPWQGHKGVSGGYMPDALFFILFWQILMFKIIQRVYCAGKFQMFYQKAAVWGRWCLSLVFLRLYAPLRIPSKCKRAAVGKTFGIASANNL